MALPSSGSSAQEPQFKGFFVRKQSVNNLNQSKDEMKRLDEGSTVPPLPPQRVKLADAGVFVIAAIWCLIGYLLITPSIPSAIKGLALGVQLLYESYIVFDHVPVFFTNTVFTTARINYQNIRLSYFWCCEALAGWFAYLVLGAHPYVLLNTPNHLYFLFCEFYGGIVTSEYFNYGRKGMWLNFAVLWDVAIHVTCVHASFCWLLGASSAGSYIALWLAAVCAGTSWFHGEYMRLGHFLVYIVGAEHATSYRQWAALRWFCPTRTQK